VLSLRLTVYDVARFADGQIIPHCAPRGLIGLCVPRRRVDRRPQPPSLVGPACFERQQRYAPQRCRDPAQVFAAASVAFHRRKNQHSRRSSSCARSSGVGHPQPDPHSRTAASRVPGSSVHLVDKNHTGKLSPSDPDQLGLGRDPLLASGPSSAVPIVDAGRAVGDSSSYSAQSAACGRSSSPTSLLTSRACGRRAGDWSVLVFRAAPAAPDHRADLRTGRRPLPRGRRTHRYELRGARRGHREVVAR